MTRKIKIFDYAWHIPHQFDMINALKEDCEFYYCLNTMKQWDTSSRKIPENLTFVTHYEENFYDLAILHIDQQAIAVNSSKRMVYTQFNEYITDIPKVVINHGSPVFPEYFKYDSPLTEEEMKAACIDNIKSLVGKNTMVVNSYTAATEKEWGFGVPIIHGINTNDWQDLPKEPRVFTALAPHGLDAYYNRNCMMKVADILHERYGHYLGYAKLNVDTGGSHEAYKEYLGKSLLYIDTSFRTPMNRARTEAFLSGCCVIQVQGAHDVERWGKHGENIILVPDEPEEIASTIVDYIEEKYDEALAIGQKGKEMAVSKFNPERYRQDWLRLISTLTTQ